MPSLASTISAKLSEVESLRLDDHRKAQQVLLTIDPQQLSPAQFEQYQYLKIMLTTYDGDLVETYKQYDDLFKSAETTVIRIRALTSRVSLASYVGKWEEGFEMAVQLQEMLTPALPDDLHRNALKGLVTFYIKADQPKIANSLINQLEPLTEGMPRQQCVLKAKKLELMFSQQLDAVSLNFILDVQSQCKEAENSFHGLYAETYLFYYLVEQQKIDQALILLDPLKQKVEKLDFLFMAAGLYAYIADLYNQMGRLDDAQQAAQNVLAMDETGEYLPSKIHALETLIAVAEQRENYQQAYHYLAALEDARVQFREANVVKQAAYQQANFELALKQSQIDLLDKRNRLLETQSELAKERVHSSMVALVFIGIILAGLLAWVYRSGKLQKKLREVARTDSLTGINNRGYFLQQTKMLLRKAETKHVTCSLLLMDLDHFKRVNDTYGHQAGDWVLIEVVRALQIVSDEHCLLGRMGGEEFGIFVYQSDAGRAVALAEQYRAAIEGIDTSQSGYRFTLTASFGVSDTSQLGYRLENLTSASDLALYQSKQYGRNRVYEYDIDIARQQASP